MKTEQCLALRIVMFAAILALAGAVPACKKQAEEAPSATAMDEAAAPPPAPLAEQPAERKRAETNAGRENEGIVGNFIAPMKLAAGRLLEYQVNLTYESKNLLASRGALLAVTAKYGFVSSSVTSTEGEFASLNADIYVKADLLYDALRDLEKLGMLVAEEIKVTDHTENMTLQERKARREDLRLLRRSRALGQVTGQARTWKEIEDAVQSSENGLDEAEQEKWKITDRVSWAGVHVFLKGPENPSFVRVPKYGNALVGMVNFILRFTYALIWLAPFIALAVAIVYYRKKIIAPFKRRKGE